MSRLHIRLLKREDGHAVALFGDALGHIITLACCLTEDEAIERAEAEADERGLAVRHA